MRIGIVTGMPQEAGCLFRGEGSEERDGELRIRDCGSAIIANAGLGKVNAAVAATRLAALGCTVLVKAGVAGRIADVEGDCFWIESAVQHDYGARRGGGLDIFTPGSIPFGPATVEPYRALADPGLGLPHARIASGDQFVADSAAAEWIASTLQAQLVDMETAAVAQVASTLGLEWAAINAVTDDAGSSGAADFAANLDAAANRAASATERLVGLLASGGGTSR